ncbi:MAG: hypothetical protein KGS61_09055 [Verrucomicrobia bacterium]|nr:hypothetical protein [Verrucomicrobiota bacterium]
MLFDIPRTRNSQRTRLRRILRDQGFGRLQDSVWITPDSMEEERRILGGSRVHVASLILLEARPCAGESDTEMVASAWDFVDINRRYAQCLKILEARPVGSLRDERIARALLRWAAIERETWLDAVGRDPLLPERLLPPGYLGQKAWRQRNEVLRKAGRQLPTFKV